MSARRFERAIFVDTSAYGALAIVRDAPHRTAVEIARALAYDGAHLYTTNFVIAEAHALILRRAGREIALRMLDRFDHSFETVIRIEVDDERRARDVVTRYRDKDFTLVDAMSFAVMERSGIEQAFTFDQHFAQYGFRIAGKG